MSPPFLLPAGDGPAYASPMQNLFDPARRDSILARLASLQPSAQRQWGKMGVAQMLAHCSVAMEAGTGDRPRKQQLIGKLLAWMVRSKVLGDQPFSRNSPTDPTFIVRDEKDFDVEKRRLISVVSKFCEAGPDSASRQTHSFLGKLSGDEWGVMMYKHIDHHLKQFDA
ncbi:MAG: DUF1569 domain-containing protein [Acidobacteriota bacterium]|nr:DUF1569 domain-containing protein [Acidobacteriota bacterium]